MKTNIFSCFCPVAGSNNSWIFAGFYHVYRNSLVNACGGAARIAAAANSLFAFPHEVA
jgi:hypothetical protein